MMPEFDWDALQRAKEAHRARLAALPFEEKLPLIEALRDKGREMKGQRSRGHESITRLQLSGISLTTSSSTMRVELFGAHAILVSAAIGNSNPTGAPPTKGR